MVKDILLPKGILNNQENKKEVQIGTKHESGNIVGTAELSIVPKRNIIL